MTVDCASERICENRPIGLIDFSMKLRYGFVLLMMKSRFNVLLTRLTGVSMFCGPPTLRGPLSALCVQDGSIIEVRTITNKNVCEWATID